jgi:hypothetical protein
MVEKNKEEITEIMSMKEVKKWLQDFYKTLWTNEESVLTQVSEERSLWDLYVEWERDEIEADLVLLRNQVKQKGKIGDTTLFNVHTALVSRSFHNKTPVKFKWDKNGIDREIKMLNMVYEEDNQTPYMKALNYYGYFDKYATWITIKAKVGWDWVYKRNIFQVINPLLAVPDPSWDYFTWDYRFIWFSSIKTKEQLEVEGYDTESLSQWQSTQWAIANKRDSQVDQWLNYLDDKWLYEVYLHFCIIENRKVWVLTGWNETKVLNAWIIPAWNKYEEKNPEAIKFPLSFKYWKPLRDNFFWDRPANYCRDVQIQKAIIANLRLDKMRAELYPMYLYNKDYVSGKDLAFWFNKGIPISTGINGPQVNLQNLVSPVQKDLRIDTSITVEQLMDRQVEKSTSIGEVVQWTTPEKRETLGTNQLIQSNTDVNLSLNEEIDLIGVEKEVQDWFAGYYQNFTDADKKLIFAWMWTGQVPINLKRKDFIYEWNLAISIESNAQSETRKRKQALAYQVTWPLILQDQSINEWSKRATLRRIAEANGIPDEDIDIEIPKTAQQILQSMENELLNDWEYIDINPDDDDEQHLMEMWSLILTKEAEAHQYAHIQAAIMKWQQANVSQNAWMLNQSQAVSNNIASAQQVSWV